MRILLFIGVFSTVGLTSCRGILSGPPTPAQAIHYLSGHANRGLVAKAGSRKRNTDFRYDLLGRPLEVTHRVEGNSYVYSYEWGYSGAEKHSDELGSLQRSMRFPDGELVLQAYDAAGKTQQVRSRLVDQTGVVYDDEIGGRTQLNRYGQIEWTDSGDGARTFHEYDPSRRLAHRVTLQAQTNEVRLAFGYEYDSRGRIRAVKVYCDVTSPSAVCCDPRQASCTESATSSRYEYDDAGWLKRARSAIGNQEFEVDALNNLIRKSGALQRYGENGRPHALTSVQDVYGQTVARYTYLPSGAMSSMEEAGVLTHFVWNARNMSTRTEQNGNVTERFYLGESLYKRTDSIQGAISTTYFLPSLRIENATVRKFCGGLAERESNSTDRRGILRFYHADHVGSSSLVTSELGVVLSRSAFLPYGEQRFAEGTFTPKRAFSTKEKEVISGVYDFGARLYNPRTGRFLSADSVRDGLNPYSYVRNDPINSIDPTGHMAQGTGCKKRGGLCDESEEPVLKTDDEVAASQPGFIADFGSALWNEVADGISFGMRVGGWAMRNPASGLAPFHKAYQRYVDRVEVAIKPRGIEGRNCIDNPNLAQAMAQCLSFAGVPEKVFMSSGLVVLHNLSRVAELRRIVIGATSSTSIVSAIYNGEHRTGYLQKVIKPMGPVGWLTDQEREQIAVEMVDLIQQTRSQLPIVPPTMLHPYEHATFIQKEVHGLEFFELGLETEIAIRQMSSAIHVATEVLKRSPYRAAGRKTYFYVDTNPSNFRFDEAGNITSWFDPFVPGN